MKLNDLRPLTQETFRGTYRLTGRIACFDDEGIPYLKLRLSSCASDMVVLAVIGSIVIPEHLGHMDLVVVKGQVCVGPEDSEVLLTEIRRPLQADVARLPALQTLPRTFCPKPEALDQLIAAVRSLECDYLQVFIKRVLERRDRLEVFLKAPASKKYHHNDPGGLLAHSLEVAQNVLRMAQINEPEMPRSLQELGFVAGLLHDIGKTYTYDMYGKPTAAARLCDHADLTLEACALGLAYLDKVDSGAALALRHIWTCASPGARYGNAPAMTLARYVRDADAQSAMADNQRKAYRKRQPAGFGRLGNNVYWRPSIEAHG
ncbi:MULTISPECIES: TraI domain-containing protein [Marinobacter]|jgi:3'-5' exoribonuclease|uniref:3'-5' exoribonuclease n=1 Tax=Marinobacter nauticus TaxID=2743 RepID=A0A368UQU3_MARNT|nr:MULTISPECIES: TraI domain-containing protein [Marinobacter]ERS89631.1 phosphohydrolase [Marinobacter sp. C1S70]RBP69120.1 3'-5' exoribonuclease [Marinobacter nauticus]RCW30525.1 3'-5' exoribonuclease [Marinobacter nauticus]